MDRAGPTLSRSAAASAVHSTTVMAAREEQPEAFWEDLPLPDQFPEPYTEGSHETNQRGAGGTSASANAEESIKEPPQPCSPNLLLMLKAAESWRTPHARDRGQDPRVGEAQRADMVSGMETLGAHVCEQLHGGVNAHAIRVVMISLEPADLRQCLTGSRFLLVFNGFE